MSDLDVLNARMELLLRASRGEFARAPIGEFEARWNAIAPARPAPPPRPIHYLTCECESCRKAYDAEIERPMVGAFPWDNS
jgi:hypothetical protein